MSKVIDAGTLRLTVDVGAKKLREGLKQSDADVASFSRRGIDNIGKFALKATAGFAAITAAAAGLGKAIVGPAAAFESEMSRIRANADGTAKELETLRTKVLDLGKTTAYSAAEVAQGANELVKAGLNIADTIGALPGMLDLAAAGELGVAEAAEITANTLSQFTLKATDAASVADTLALAANLSTTEVGLMGQSLNNVATIAANMGWTVQETSAALALMANNGVKGAMAGTSLKSMLMQLMVPTSDAAELMEKYGINLYDANGETVKAAELIRRLQEGLSGLSDADRDLAAGKIFGTYGIRAFNILAKEGVGAFDSMTEAVSRSGAAQDIAATKMDNLKGSWKMFKSSLEGFAIDIGSKALPKLREFVDDATGAINTLAETGDWTALGGTIGGMIGEGIKTAAPVVISSVGEVVRVALDALTGGSQFEGSTPFDRWSNYLSDRMAVATDGAVNEYGMKVKDRVPTALNDALLKGLEDLKNKEGIQGLLERDFFGEPTEDQLINLLRGTGVVITEKDFPAIQRIWDVSTEKLAALADEQSGAVREAMNTLLYGSAEITNTSMFGDMTGGLIGLGNAAADAEAPLESAADALARVNGETTEEAQARIDGYAKALSGLYAAEVNPGQVWEDAEGSLNSYLTALDKQLEAWGDFEGNLMSLAEQFGPEFGADVIMKAAEIGPEFVASLVGADPATVQKALGQLDKLLGNNQESLTKAVVGVCSPAGTAGGTAMAEKADAAATAYVNDPRNDIDFAAMISTDNVAAKGTSAAAAFHAAFDRGMKGQTVVVPFSFQMQGGGIGGGAADGPVSASRASFIDYADNFLGVPYVWGGTSSRGWDCSGYAQNMLGRVGIGAPRTSWEQARYFPRTNNPLPGDLLFYSYGRRGSGIDHVAIYAGGGYQLEARNSRVGTIKSRVGSYEWAGRVPLPTYDQGGVLPPGVTLAANLSGVPETIVTAPQESALTKAIADLIASLKQSLAKDGDLTQAITSAFSDRSALAGSYISRESARYGMYEAEGAPTELLERTLSDQITFISRAVDEAQAQLDAAKAQKLPAETINELAGNLFDLRAQAADARKELEDLARVPLEKTLDSWNDSIDQTRALMNILGEGSASTSGLSGVLMTSLLGEQQANLSLMNASTDPSDIRSYGSAAADAVSDMFSVRRDELDKALQDELDTIADAQDDWEKEWQDRSEALEKESQRQRDALQQQLSDLRENNQAALRELQDYYSDKISALREANAAEDRETSRAKTRAEIASLYAQGGLTASDLSRLQSLRAQQAEQEKQWARDDQISALEAERDAKVTALEEQQAAAEASLEAQIEAQDASLEALRESLDAEREAKEASYAAQEQAARDSYQAQLDTVVTMYAGMLATVFEAQNLLLGQTNTWATAIAGLTSTLSAAATDAVTAASDITAAGGTGGAGASTSTSAGLSYTPATGASSGETWTDSQGNTYQIWGGDRMPFVRQGLGWMSYTPGEGTLRAHSGRYAMEEYLKQWGGMVAMAEPGILLDQGGWLPPGISTVMNFTGQPELVTPMRNLRSGSVDHTGTIRVIVEGPGVTDQQAMQMSERLTDHVIARLGQQQYLAGITGGR